MRAIEILLLVYIALAVPYVLALCVWVTWMFRKVTRAIWAGAPYVDEMLADLRCCLPNATPWHWIMSYRRWRDA